MAADHKQPQVTIGAEAGACESQTQPDSLLTTLGLSRNDVRFAVLLGGLIVLLMLAHWARQSLVGAQLVEIDRLPARTYQFQIDINSATWVEWMQMEGVGDVLARRIVTDRDENGPFTSIENVQRVMGVGPKTLDAIRPHLFCSDCSPTSDSS